jgi:murein DD-endopeptidase MepM/ murein hydrolase activator NlpD
MKHLGKIIIGFVSMTLLGITMLLVIEYRFFHDQAQKMMDLKEEYRTYTLAVKKILNEYNAMKEQAEQAGQSLAEKNNGEKDSFIVVNREPNYLKKSMINYLRQENLDFVLNQIDLNEWVDYNEQVLRKTSKQNQITKKGKKRKRTGITRINHKLFSHSPSEIPHDICLSWPIDRSQFWLSSFFGPRRNPDRSWGFHHGIDMAAVKGTPVKAAAAGVVIEAHFHNGFGNTIVISHSNKYKTRYAHLDKILVSIGQKVDAGTLIGKVGATGAVRKKRGRDASHLHFEVYSFGKRINPLYFFM